MLQLFLIVAGLIVAVTLSMRWAANYSNTLLLIFGLINGGLIYLKGRQTLAVLYVILFIATITMLIFWKYLSRSQLESETVKLKIQTIGLVLTFLIGSVAFVYFILSGYDLPKTNTASPTDQSLFAMLLAGILLSFLVGIANLKQWPS